jgi:hypothetical protein
VNLRRVESEPAARGTVSVVRMRASLALLLVACGCLAETAAGNGDPASDVLLSENVYLPNEAPSASAAKALNRAVEAAYVHHFRIKVAVIAGQIDLGTVPSLYGKPMEYAKFLGTELESLYVGPLLIVMPAGFGIYDGGRSVAAEEHVLESMSVRGPDSESLTRTAGDAVDRLVSSRALRSKDIRAPFVAALPLTVHRGAVARLAFRVGDDSGWSRIVARVMVKSRVIATRRSRLLRVTPSKPVSLRWRASRNLPNRGVRICVVAADAARNRSAKTCSLVRVL